MRWAIILMTVAACNAVFGIKDTHHLDAAYFDAPPDAAWGCPALGQPPVLDPQLHQDILQWCESYALAGDRAIARCYKDGQPAFYEGVVHQMLTPSVGLPATAGEDFYDQPRMSSDGQELYLRHFNYSTNAEDAQMFTRGSDGVWVPGPPPPFGRNVNDNLSLIVAGPTGDHIFITNGTTPTPEEWIHEPAGWRDAGGTSLAGLTPTSLSGMTPIDPLRVLVVGYDRHTYYTDRPDPSSPFRTAVRLDAIPDYAFDPFVTPDCGRVYVTGLHSIFYVQQP